MVVGKKCPTTYAQRICDSHTYGGHSFYHNSYFMTVNKNEAGNSLPKAFTFNASNQRVRTVMIDGEPYFVAKDVCDILQLSDVSMTTSHLDDDEKLTQVLFVSGQGRRMWLVNESGLYHLIFQSRKPEAKAFRKWVTSEVLPSLRKTGRYELAAKSSSVPCPYVGGFIDLRTVPYTSIMLEGFPVRTIRHNDTDWYSLNDIHTAFKTRTDSSQDARRILAAGPNLAKKDSDFQQHQSCLVRERHRIEASNVTPYCIN